MTSQEVPQSLMMKFVPQRTLRLTREKVIAKANLVHNNKYTYDKLVWVHTRVKCIITCPIHGDFVQLMNSHFNGHGCAACGYDKNSSQKRRLRECFLTECRHVHGNTYNYDDVEYKGNKHNIVIICSEHGKFSKIPHVHLRGSGCPKCSKKGWSKIAIEWLSYRALQDGVYIEHAGNEGERVLRIQGDKSIRVDGFCQLTNTVYEFHGSYWHGDPAIYTDPTFVNPTSKRSMGELYKETMHRDDMIRRSGYCLITIWETEWTNIVSSVLCVNSSPGS